MFVFVFLSQGPFLHPSRGFERLSLNKLVSLVSEIVCASLGFP